MSDAQPNTPRPEWLDASGQPLSARLAQVADAIEKAIGQAGDDTSTADAARRTAQLKDDIIACFREADAALLAAQSAKDAVKALAERWKVLNANTPSVAPDQSPSAQAPSTAAAPISARVDLLGASTFVEKGWNLLSLGQVPEAIVALQKALALAPGQVEALVLLAWAYVNDGQLDAAHAPLEQARAQAPDDALAVMVWGRWLALQGHFTDADRCLEQAAASGDGRAALYAHLYRAQLQRTLGAHDAAALTLRQALQKGPNLVQAWYELGRTHWECGRRADALQAWQSGSAANKFSPWGKRCAALLDLVSANQELVFVDT
ncbi:tetratricopeptide repeat protein [Gemmatimonas sp. UBA7669]|uniref:tetratricopeptide repeat protein n=1 Tax=Gemmatimonas sp. UBA7669 TaxID=1946568 RepID=UPI0025B9D63E|nr:tetratricopeptide repeat protein [Gemmatimonas sp. UBA7669]